MKQGTIVVLWLVIGVLYAYKNVSWANLSGAMSGTKEVSP